MLDHADLERAARPWVHAAGRFAPIRFGPYVRSLMVVALATGLAALINLRIEVPNISLVLLVGVLFCAFSYGLGPSLFASAISVLSYDFFFLPPLFHFDIDDPPNVVAAIVFLIVAVLVSKLAARARQQASIAEQRAAVMAELHRYSGALAGIAHLETLGLAATRQIATVLKVEGVLLLPEGERVTPRFAYPAAAVLADPALAVAQGVWQRIGAESGTATALQRGDRLFAPLRTERGAIGLLALQRAGHYPVLSAEEHRLLDALANQTAVALERIRLADTIDQARLVAETERLRSALLRSISHDLRTPLASILGSITGLRAYGAAYEPAARDELMATIQDEAERLNRFVGNLLDMTRLESGALDLKRGVVYLDEVVGTALQRSAKTLARHRVELDISDELPPLDVDFLLFEQVLVNLLDNAAKYAAPSTSIAIRGRVDADRMILEVMDEGPGIPGADLERVFDPFYRVQATDRRGAGTGLGLAICRGFIEAVGGRIVAANRSDRAGAVLSMTLPIGQAPELEEEPEGAPFRAPVG